jgi:DNA repair protein RadB
MENKIATGASVLDKLLEGGYERDIVTTIYGPSASGKTTACLLCAVEAAKHKKVIFVDTEGGFSVTRLKQLTKNHKSTMDKIFFLNPTNFGEQKRVFEKLKNLVNDKISLVVVDTISSLYREEVSKDEAYQEANRALGKQLSFLVEIARKKQIPVLVTSQVYASFDDRSKINVVGGDIVKYRSKCLIEMQIQGNKRRAILRKHRHLPEREVFFEIQESGFSELKKGFKLF